MKNIIKKSQNGNKKLKDNNRGWLFRNKKMNQDLHNIARNQNK